MPHHSVFVDAEQALACIASRDSQAATLGSLVLHERISVRGNVTQWVEQLQTAVESLQGSHGKTRLAHIAARELAAPLLEIIEKTFRCGDPGALALGGAHCLSSLRFIRHVQFHFIRGTLIL